MIRMRSGFVTQSQNELKDFEAELLSMVCSDVEICLSRYLGRTARKEF